MLVTHQCQVHAALSRRHLRCVQGLPPGAGAAEAGRERGASGAAARKPWLALAQVLAGRREGQKAAHAGAAELAHRRLQVRTLDFIQKGFFIVHHASIHHASFLFMHHAARGGESSTQHSLL